MNVPTRAAEKYIQRIKNTAKKQYARDYYAWILAGRRSTSGNGPEWDRNALSYMAAQGVRMNLDELYPHSEDEHAPELNGDDPRAFGFVG